MFDRPYAIVDVETTGASAWFHKVIEIGIIRIEKGEVVSTYQTLLNPETKLSHFITSLTGITDADLTDAPLFDDIKDDVLELLRDAVFVAHNSSFDYHFIKQEFRRCNYMFNADSLCTVRLSRALFPKYKHHNLTELIKRFEFECKNRHRALDDAKVLWDFFQYIEKEFEPNAVEDAFKKILKPSKVLSYQAE